MQHNKPAQPVTPPRPVTLPAGYARYRPPRTWRDTARSIKRELQTYRDLAKAKPRSDHPHTKFCVFAPGRSGSTLLFDMANAHPHIQCEAHAKDAEILGARFLWPRRYVEARAKLGSAPIYGFKLQLNHLTIYNPTDPEKFIRDLHAGGWKLIYLTRRNIFRQAISLCIAYQTQVWHRARDKSGRIRHLEQSRADWNQVALDVELLRDTLEYLTGNLRYTNFIMQSIPHLKLEYEDDLFTPAQQERTMTRVFAHLGAPPHAVSTTFVRSSKDNWRDVLVNPDEVEYAVRGTRYEEFIDVP